MQTFYATHANFTVSHKVADVYELLSRLTPDEQRALLIDLNCDISYLNEPYDAVRVRYTTQENDPAQVGPPNASRAQVGLGQVGIAQVGLGQVTVFKYTNYVV